jgi:hypothetical protein
MNRPIEYLYDPDTVSARLAGLPRIQAILRGSRVGQPSVSFPRLLKTRREILRVLGRHDLYAHLDRLLEEIEQLLAHGWTTHQLKASSHDEFGSLVSEVLVASHFDKAGLQINPTTGQTVSGVKPEFYVSDGSMTAAVEVFQPRDWRLIDAFIRKGTQLLYDADVPFDYAASLDLRLDHHFDEKHKLVHPHPALLEAGLAAAGAGFLEKLTRELERLVPGERTLIVSRPGVNLELEVVFGPVQEADGDEPARAISHGYSTSGYVPEAIFHDILEKVLDKAQRRQAGQPGSPHTRLLAVDLSTSPIQPHLTDGPRQSACLDDIRDTLGPSVADGDYDIVALCQPSFNEGLNARFVCTSAAAVASALLSSLPPATVVV